MSFAAICAACCLCGTFDLSLALSSNTLERRHGVSDLCDFCERCGIAKCDDEEIFTG